MQNFLGKDAVSRDNGGASREAGHVGAETPDVALTTDAGEGIDMATADSTPGKAPAFQFYPKDFLTDEHVALMSLQERGAYITLICYCWQQGSLPAEHEHLARFCGTPLAVFRRLWPSIAPCFRPHPSQGDRLVHPRLEKERKKQRDFRRLQSEKGRASAARRKATAVQPSLNRGSTERQPTSGASVQPESNSPISDLRSASPDSGQKSVARGFGGGVMAGSLPRDHINCRQPCERICVSQKQHRILVERHGGTDADLDAFYADVRARLDPAVPIGDRAWEFWEKQFAARFGTMPAANSRTAGNPAAAARFVARGRA